MKIFLDTANRAHIKQWKETGLIDGVTTNPSHLSAEKNNPTEQILAVCALLPEGEISVEVTCSDPDAVYKQAKQIAALSDNIIVKIPCHPPYFSVINRLVQEEVAINVTLVFTLLQATMMSKLGVWYISPFVGRLEDVNQDGIQLLYEIREMLDAYEYDTQLLAASIRDVAHFHTAILAGADAVTVPVAVFEQAVHHPLTDKGMVQFDADWQKLGVQQFP